MTIPLLIWDLDGTLVDSRQDLAEAGNAARASLGLEALPLATVSSFVGDGLGKLIERLTPEADAKDRTRARSAFERAYQDTCTVHTRPFPGIPETLEKLQSLGWTQAIATNKGLAFSLRIIAGLHLSRFFADVQGGDGPKKPDPFQLVTIARLLQGDLARSWMIGDHHTDLRAGRAAGTRTLLVRWGMGHPDGEHPDAEAKHPTDILRLV